MSLRVHHLNCGTMCPVCAPLINGRGASEQKTGWLDPARMVCHVLLIETPKDGLVLVDTGIGALDIQTPERLGRPFLALTRARLDFRETAIAQVKKLGYNAEDVRHIIVTHLDLDHASGLPDFPQAQVHVFEPEFQAAMKPDWRSKARYLPAQWAHSPRWLRHTAGGENWFGFAGLRPLPGIGEDILMVPLVGHTRGHTGIAVRSEKGWLLHCGDAYFFHGQLEATPHMPWGIAAFEKLVQTDRRARIDNLERLRLLNVSHGSNIQLFCAHDPVEFERENRR
jgi:glyoxylase-like metal-dependent hydrolase (beta-lactamase superfamily II)